MVVERIVRTAMDEMSKKGAFVRTPSKFRNWIKPGGKFEPAANRYHLYISYACPWASSVLAVRNLKGLESAISISVVDPVMVRTSEKDDHIGWVFKDESAFPGNVPDNILGAKSVRELYEMQPNPPSKFTVPVLFDKKTNLIVNNESLDIIKILNSEFNEFARDPKLDLYPEELKESIESLNSDTIYKVNNGVYRSGFSTTQESYDEAVKELFSNLDDVEALLSKRKYLLGDRLTLLDVRLYVTTIRFDEVYHTHFKCNKAHLFSGYPNIWRHLKMMYSIPEVKLSTNMDHIKHHYYRSHKINVYSIVPAGPGVIKMLDKKNIEESNL